jgi:AraC-like DNA-binding protein
MHLPPAPNAIFTGCRPETFASRESAVERVIHAMNQQMEEPMSLQHLAKHAMVSSSHLDHIFRQITGVCPRRYMGALRLAHAKRMLLDTELKVIDISLEAGYSSVGTFTRRFTRLVGVAPLQLRKLSKNGVVKDMLSVRNRATNSRMPVDTRGVYGHVTAPAGFGGIIFIGLFHGPIPEGRPVECTVVTGPGAFSMPEVTDGKYHIFAMAFEWLDDPMSYLTNEDALRGPVRPLLIEVKNGTGPSGIHLDLRPAELTDPPILVTIPALVAESLQQGQSRTRP